MSRTITPGEFFTLTKVLVMDALAFANNPPFGVSNPHQYKKIKIYTHRRIGFTITAIKLVTDFQPSVLITSSMKEVNRLQKAYPTFLQHQRVLTMDEVLMIGALKGYQYMLAVLDGCEYPKIQQMIDLENEIMAHSRLLVELG